MTEPWAATGRPDHGALGEDRVTLIDGSTFCISERDGRVRVGQAQGLFVRDSRYLSRWELRLDGVLPEPLITHRGEPFGATFIGRMPPPAGHADSWLLVLVHRYVGNGMREDVELRNLASEPVTCVVTLDLDADFADLFEVKAGRGGARGTVAVANGDSAIDLRHEHTPLGQAVRVESLAAAEATGRTLRWVATIPARDTWSVTVSTQPFEHDVPLPLRHPHGHPVEHTEPARSLREWRQRGPRVSTADVDLAAVLRQSVEDLGALRMFDPKHPRRAVVAAGMPWFMALFGRDSLLTSWMLLPIDQRLAIGTAQTLAAHQGVVTDPVTEEQPGRILHEMRFGQAAALALGGGTAYYGTVDATALFVMLVGELRRWGLDDEQFEELLPHIDRAMAWLTQHGDIDGDGFVEYHRASENGLVNQGWKDSWDGVTFASGELAASPIALAEVQAYSYGAYRARAYLAGEQGDEEARRHWSDRAAALKGTFNETFWLPERGWFALGLDADKRPIDALASNMGHCLWTGIVDDDKAPEVARWLLSPELFSGWGIRTLATSMGAYNPMSYHNGSVWPHDNAICAAGLMRYGFVPEAQRVAVAILAAAREFGHRLPELFCGFSRDDFTEPVPYPTSCAPQAWSAAAPLLMLRTLLRLDPQLPQGHVAVDPAVPARYLPLEISGLRIGASELTIRVTEDETVVHGLGHRVERH
ncbi:glycogen debranching N-terminal domain-containing protein [Haloechinothrix salitolerans]|uniref:Glycogen debranching N-terminal domain-containing protein n=1 Tax=Haloechinothrix salitolerans TaxID=926830 RepID=A0ABW2C195_9PSEU